MTGPKSDTPPAPKATPAAVGSKDRKLEENSKENLDDKLDKASEDSFPASDPVSVKITK